MDVSSFVLLSHEQALRRRLDIAANNMANSSTVGFKREQPVFHEYVQRAEAAPVRDAKATSFVLDYGAVHDTAQGAFQPTGNPLDVMIDGAGYLAVETADGEVAYTRAGHLKVLATGELAIAGGQRVLNENGRPIVIAPEQSSRTTVTADGTVLGPGGPFGRLGITVFADERQVSPRGDGLMTGAGGRPLAAAEARLRVGGIEASNVQPIVETTELIEIMRSYQNSRRMSESINELRKRAIDRLGRVG